MDLDDLDIAVDNTYELGGSDDERERAQNAALVEQLERKKRLRRMAVPTDDKKVKERLRAFGEPITLFGEGPGDRRDRLKLIQEQIEQRRGLEGINYADYDAESSSEEEDEGEFYTEGSHALLEERRKIARYSLSRARTRIARQRIEVSLPLGKIINARKDLFSSLKTFSILGSQFGDDRPLSTIRFSPDSKLVLTTSWTGETKLWDLPNLNLVGTKRGHSDRLGGAAWYPGASVEKRDTLGFATGGGEGDVKLWSIGSDTAVATLSGHTNRVGRVAFHPSGAYLGSASFDGTWRLWDVESQKELMTQEGHSKEVYALGFQDDGALVASGGFDAIGRVWDLRTGRTAMVLDGHIKEILAVDFAPNGYQVATGSGDDTVRIWDLRALKTQYIIPAHKSSVSDLSFFRSSSDIPFQPLPSISSHSASQPSNPSIASPVNGTQGSVDVEMDHASPSSDLPVTGLFLVTAGFDNMVRIWSADEWALIMRQIEQSRDGKLVGSASYSRSFHLFGHEGSL
ncbi:hypothetical protein TREMEDRAFT_69097 [Tremella mesenterica DSM 1558]|uniref:uncharacterized protein n=1 Tax=Tremella mesenterica (strain ATCC 24925 / CBS 8224 / DSM 1558 / NBRC 9311 / NRRL Y-6157 / RJB 2259-6 / UBC 559-6) TaxID=578456 RepID=UPI0003F48CDB|nr:uncharacterized protein TREMEDRAFT_69097 [Tremella mesenterica DSM 1558]EIW68618.1 hypothetical protein TREMEDRAFT_69097 [Tremella mesenterica DSM 1558]